MKIKFFKRFGFLHRRSRSESAALPAANASLPPSQSAGALRSHPGAPYVVSERTPYLAGPAALPPLVAVPAITLSPPAPSYAPPTITLTAPASNSQERPLPSTTLSPPAALTLAPPIVLEDPPVSPEFALALQKFALFSPPALLEVDAPQPSEDDGSPSPTAVADLRSRIASLEAHNATLRSANQDLEQTIKADTVDLSARRAQYADTLEQLHAADTDAQDRKRAVVARLARLRTFAQALRDLDLDKARSNPRAAPLYCAATHDELVETLATNARAAAGNSASPWAEIVPMVEGAPTSPSYTHQVEDALVMRQAARRARRMTKFWKKRAEACGVDVAAVALSPTGAPWVDEEIPSLDVDGGDDELEGGDDVPVHAGPSTSTMGSVADDPFKFDAPGWGVGRRVDGMVEIGAVGDEEIGVAGKASVDAMEVELDGEVGVDEEFGVIDQQERKDEQDTLRTMAPPSRLPVPNSPSGRKMANSISELRVPSSSRKRGATTSQGRVRRSVSQSAISSTTSTHSTSTAVPPSTSTSVAPSVSILLPSASTSVAPSSSTAVTPSTSIAVAPSTSTAVVPSTSTAVTTSTSALAPLASQLFHEEMRASRSRERMSLGSLSSAKTRGEGTGTERSQERNAQSRERMPSARLSFGSLASVRNRSRSRSRKRRSASAGERGNTSAGKTQSGLVGERRAGGGEPLTESGTRQTGVSRARRSRSASRHGMVDEVGRRRVGDSFKRAKNGSRRVDDVGQEGTTRHEDNLCQDDAMTAGAGPSSIGAEFGERMVRRRPSRPRVSQSPGRRDRTLPEVPPIGHPIPMAGSSRRRRRSPSTGRQSRPSVPLPGRTPAEITHTPRRAISLKRSASPMRLRASPSEDPSIQVNSAAAHATAHSTMHEHSSALHPRSGPLLAPPLPRLNLSLSASSAMVADSTEQPSTPGGASGDEEEVPRVRSVRALRSLEQFVASLSARTLSTLSSARSLGSMPSGRPLSSQQSTPPLSYGSEQVNPMSGLLASSMATSRSEASGLALRPASIVAPDLAVSRSEAAGLRHADGATYGSQTLRVDPSRSGFSAATSGSVSELPWRRPVGDDSTLTATTSEDWRPGSLPSGSLSAASLSASPSRMPRLRMGLGSGASEGTRKGHTISKDDISGPAALQSSAGLARLRGKASAERLRVRANSDAHRTRAGSNGSRGKAAMSRAVSEHHMGARANGDPRLQSGTTVGSVGRHHRRAEALRGEGAGAAHKRSRPLAGDGAGPLAMMGRKGRRRTSVSPSLRPGRAMSGRANGEEFVSNGAAWDAVDASP